MTTLVVGRGLLGRAVVTELEARTSTVHTVDVPWGRPGLSVRALLGAAERAASTDDEWRLAWTAGAGVIASQTADLEAEIATFGSFLRQLPFHPSALFLASSAGGVYAGSDDRAPFTEQSRVRALSSYGRAKLAMEAAASRLARHGVRVLIGRLANLYGPGQDLSRPQGIVSQLCVSHVTRQPLTIYASMDSLRDYIYVGDVATKIVKSLDHLMTEDSAQVVVKILASGESRSVGSVIGESTRVFRRRPHLVIRGSDTQIMDLRLRSTVWTMFDEVPATPFVVGLRATADDVSSRVRGGGLNQAWVRASA